MLLFLNDIAGSEVLLIIFFVLMFFGSKSIPGLAKTLGRTFRQIREASNDLQSEIKKTTGEMTGNMNLNAILKETEQELRQPLDQMTVELENAIKYDPASISKPSIEESEKTTEKLLESSTDQPAESIMTNDTPSEKSTVPSDESGI